MHALSLHKRRERKIRLPNRKKELIFRVKWEWYCQLNVEKNKLKLEKLFF